MAGAPPGWELRDGQWVKTGGFDVKAVVSNASQYIADRSGEVSTQVAAASGIVLAPTLYQHAGAAIVAGLAGDYFTCAVNAAPVIVGVGSIIAGIFTKEKSKGPTDEEIHDTVINMPRDKLVCLLAKLTEAGAGSVQAGSS